jgi:proteasome assembly chaperone (PAC2) family protein
VAFIRVAENIEMWERLEVDAANDNDAMRTGDESVLLVALSTMVPQYQALYSHAKELSKFLLKKLEFRKFASLYSSSLPPEVVIESNGILRLHSNQFYSHVGRQRIILLAGDGSPFDDQQQYAHTVLSFAHNLGVKQVISVGARWSESLAPTGASFAPVGFATDITGIKELEGLGVTITKSEPAPFFANLVVAMTDGYGMKGYKLGVDHGEPSPHPRSLIQIIDVLSRMLGLEIDLNELAVRAKELVREGPTREVIPEVPRERTGIYG